MQVFSKNMSHKGEPVIAPCSSDDNWTSISFQPDLARFGMESLEEDSVALMRKRVYDMAGILGKGVKVGCCEKEPVRIGSPSQLAPMQPTWPFSD